MSKLKIIFNALFEEKVEREQNTRKDAIVNRLMKLGYDVKALSNGNFEVVGNYQNYNKSFNSLFIKFKPEGILVEDELGFTLHNFPRILTPMQICYVVKETILLEQAS